MKVSGNIDNGPKNSQFNFADVPDSGEALTFDPQRDSTVKGLSTIKHNMLSEVCALVFNSLYLSAYLMLTILAGSSFLTSLTLIHCETVMLSFYTNFSSL